MTRTLIRYCLLVAVLVGLTVPTANAQRVSPDTDRGGTSSSTYLLLPLTARSASLGASITGGLSGLNGIEASYQNPAGLVLNTGTTALFSRMEYVADIGVNYFGVGQRIGNNQIALTVAAWDFGDIQETTEINPEVDPNRTWSATYVTAGLTYARLFTDRIAAGVTAKFVSESMADDLNASTIAFDAGMTYAVGESGLRFGVSLRNFGGAMTYGGDGLVRQVVVRGESGERSAAYQAEDFELPSLLNFGVTYSRDMGAGTVVSVLGNFRSNALEEDQYAAGLELNLRNIIQVRGGYEYQANLDDSFYEGWNLGAGLNLELQGNRLTVDYAYRATQFFDGVNMITASLTL